MDIVAFPRQGSCFEIKSMKNNVQPLKIWQPQVNKSSHSQQVSMPIPLPDPNNKQKLFPPLEKNFLYQNRISIAYTNGKSTYSNKICQNDIKIPNIEFNSKKTKSNFWQPNSNIYTNNVTTFYRTFRNLNENKNLNSNIDRLTPKSAHRNGPIKADSRQELPVHYQISAEETTPVNRSANRHFRTITILYDSMASLKLDNRQDLASNDHARNHIKQKQWIRSELVKNWRRASVNQQNKKLNCNSNSSSGQKSDVVSGNSYDTLPSTSSNEGNYPPVFDFQMDAERKESIDKCIRWMGTLPEKFSGMNIFTPSVSD